MSDESAFLNAIQANPKDDAPRLVYADWLDERGDEQSGRKAAFLRMTARLITARSPLGRAYWEDKLRAAASDVEAAWMAAVSRLRIEACTDLFRFRCPKQWENLRGTADPRIRACDACRKSVHFSDTIAEAQDHARAGRCVALSLAIPRHPDDLAMSTPGRRFTSDLIQMLGEMTVLGQVRPDAPTEGRPGTDSTTGFDHRSDPSLRRKARGRPRRRKRSRKSD
jgi:uncharacterized protein (TIGR02996 family)